MNHLWQATLIAALAVLAAAVMGKAPARARQLLWAIAFLKFILPSFLLVSLLGMITPDTVKTANEQRPPIQEQAARFPEPVTTGLKFVTQITQPVPRTAVITPAGLEPSHNEYLCVWTLIWLTGVLALIARWVAQHWQFSRALRDESQPACERAAAALQRAMNRLMTRHRIGLRGSDQVCEPCVWGSFYPIILLPTGLTENLTEEELEAVILHEMVHVLHCDNLISALQMIVCCILWFHPAVWLIDRRLLAEREMLCDERVIHLGTEPTIYAAGLWKAAQFGLGWPVSIAARATGSNLRRRVERMLSREYQLNRTFLRRARAGAVIISLIALVFGVAGLSEDNALARSGADEFGSESVSFGGVSAGSNAVAEGDLTRPGASNRTPARILPPDWYDALSAAPEQEILFENPTSAPLVITGVKIRLAQFDGFYALRSVVTLERKSDREISTGIFQYEKQSSKSAMLDDFSFVNISGGRTATVDKIWFIEKEKASLLEGAINDLTIRITRLTFLDETRFEKLVRKLQGSPYEMKLSKEWPGALTPIQMAPEFVARIKELPDAPVAISNGSVGIGEMWEVNPNSHRILFRANLSLSNRTDRRVTSVAFDVNNSMFRFGPIRMDSNMYSSNSGIVIAPFSAKGYSAETITNIEQIEALLAAPRRFSYGITGVGFEDGSYWSADTRSLSSENYLLLRAPKAQSTNRPLYSRLLGKRSSFLSRLLGRETEQEDSDTNESLSEVDDLVEKSSVTVLPKVEHTIPPAYTAAARANETAGTVILEVLFRSDKRIGDIRVIKALPDGLTEQAIHAAKGMRFVPAKLNDRSVSIRSNIEFQFALAPNQPR